MVALKDEYEVVRWCAADGLGDLGDMRAIPALEWARDHDEAIDEFGESVRHHASQAIEKIRANPLSIERKPYV